METCGQLRVLGQETGTITEQVCVLGQETRTKVDCALETKEASFEKNKLTAIFSMTQHTFWSN